MVDDGDAVSGAAKKAVESAMSEDGGAAMAVVESGMVEDGSMLMVEDGGIAAMSAVALPCGARPASGCGGASLSTLWMAEVLTDSLECSLRAS